MSKKMTKMQLRMAAIGNNMLDTGAEFYKSAKIREEIKNKIKMKKEKDEA